MLESGISLVYLSGKFDAYFKSGNEMPLSSTKVGFEPFLLISCAMNAAALVVLSVAFIGMVPLEVLTVVVPVGVTLANAPPVADCKAHVFARNFHAALP